ncbi:MAG TPA: flavin reductase family protein [Gammaproteobacteria bacterium]|nr:flavin reductase family protein [Gammaproteobacteria bacterium]
MFYEPKDPHGLPHNPLYACIVPRPIGWISSLSADGHVNLAPFSFFNAVSMAPPMLMFCNNGPHAHGGVKDSERNAASGGEFVFNMATWDLREQMNLTSAALPHGGDEFELAGLTKAPSRIVKPPRVAESPIALECRTWKLVELPPSPDGSPNTMVIGEVVGVHIADEALTNGLVDTARIKPIGRLGYTDYVVVDEVFSMTRPRVAR